MQSYYAILSQIVTGCPCADFFHSSSPTNRKILSVSFADQCTSWRNADRPCEPLRPPRKICDWGDKKTFATISARNRHRSLLHSPLCRAAFIFAKSFGRTDLGRTPANPQAPDGGWRSHQTANHCAAIRSLPCSHEAERGGR